MTVGQMMEALSRLYSPSSARAYIDTMASLFPHLKKQEGWNDHYKLYAKKANIHKAHDAKQAVPLTLEKMKELLAKWGEHNSRENYTVLFVWLAGSRYGDLQHMRWIEKSAKIIPEHQLIIGVMDMAGSKGDPTGDRGDRKTVVLPLEWAHHIISQCKGSQKDVVTSYYFKKALQQVDKTLSLHSGRRGCTWAHALNNETKLEVQKLTLHQQQARRESSSMDTYTNGLYFTDQRDIAQINLQLKLLNAINKISLSTMQYVSQIWLPSAPSLFQVTTSLGKEQKE